MCPDVDMTEEEQRLKRQVDVLFFSVLERDPRDDLRTLAEFLEYLSGAIDCDRLAFTAHAGLATKFESASLLLREHVSLCSFAVRDEVERIYRDTSLLESMSLLIHASPRELRRLRMRALLGPVLNVYFLRAFFSAGDLQVETPKRLKITLTRLSEICRFAASQNLAEPDESTVKYDGMFDPRLINVPRLVNALTALLENVRQKDKDPCAGLEARLLELIQELRKPKPKWVKIFAGVFAIVSVLANLKTLDPETFTSTFDRAREVASIIHSEAWTGRAANTHLRLPSEECPLDPLTQSDVLPRDAVAPKEEELLTEEEE